MFHTTKSRKAELSTDVAKQGFWFSIIKAKKLEFLSSFKLPESFCYLRLSLMEFLTTFVGLATGDEMSGNSPLGSLWQETNKIW